jgi:HYDIN/CFA65/VesB-like, Ig-like domain
LLDSWLTTGLLANNGAVISLQIDSDCAAFSPPAIPAPCFAVNIFERQVFVAGGDVSPGGTELPRISVVPEQIDFGAVGSFAARMRRVTLTNTGTADLISGDLSASNPPDAPFAFSVICLNQTLPPQGSCTFYVSVYSNITGEFADTLDVPSNDPDRPSVQIDLHVDIVDLGGAVVGMRPGSVLCRNLHNGAMVSFPLNGRTSWDCEAHGLPLSRGDPVQMIVIGIADQ